MDNIKVFWGSDHKVGVTMISQSYSELLASNTGKNILMISLSDNLGDDFQRENVKEIDELKSRLSCGLMTKEYIFNFAIKQDSFYRINGFSNIINALCFTPEMITQLLTVACEAFDYVVVDCGTGINNPAVKAALNIGRNNTYIFTQQESSIRRWELTADYMEKNTVKPSLVIINKYIKGDQYTTKYISQRLRLPQNIFKTVIESDFGNQAEADRKTILSFGETQFADDIKDFIS